MAYNLVSLRLSFIWCCCVFIYFCSCDKEMYADVERPMITYVNPEICDNFTIVSKRLSRRDPMHYSNVYFRLLKDVDSTCKIHAYVYELLTNVYKRSFIEFHVGCCDLIESDNVIGVFFKRKLLRQSSPIPVTCPLLATEYIIPNVTFPPVPFLQKFPFQNGRIYVNITLENDKIIGGYGHMDADMYIEVDHPVITFTDPKYSCNVSLVSRRYSRKDPLRYFSVCFTTLIPIDKYCEIDAYFYELLTNVYKRSFIEYHLTCCYFIESDMLIGSFFRNKIQSAQKTLALPLRCPLPAGSYCITNVTFPPIPIMQKFPFENGRIFVNFTRFQQPVFSTYVDMTLKPYPYSTRKIG